MGLSEYYILLMVLHCVSKLLSREIANQYAFHLYMYWIVLQCAWERVGMVRSRQKDKFWVKWLFGDGAESRFIICNDFVLFRH